VRIWIDHHIPRDTKCEVFVVREAILKQAHFLPKKVRERLAEAG
jgi:hypothetical protein